MGYIEEKWITDIPEDILKILAKYCDINGLGYIAKWSHSNDVLNILIKGKDNSLCEIGRNVICAEVAKNLSINDGIAEYILSNSDKLARACLATNSNLSIRFIEQLARDSDEFVRCMVASNSNTPLYILEIFSKQFKTADAVANNPKTPSQLLEEIVSSEEIVNLFKQQQSNYYQENFDDFLLKIINHPNATRSIVIQIQKLINERKIIVRYDSIAEFKKKGIKIPTDNKCFIATAAYNEITDNEELTLLRNFRDDFLFTSFIGIIFFKIYCFISPPIAKFISNYKLLKKIVIYIILKPFSKCIKHFFYKKIEIK